VNSGNVNAGDLCQLFYQVISGKRVFLTRANRCGNFSYDFFSFADNKGINKINKRRRIKTAGAARDYQGMSIFALFAGKRYASQIQHVEHIGLRQIIL
jgi:hypothetical protein